MSISLKKKKKLANKVLEVRYVPIEEQPTDILTKPLLTSRYQYLCNKLNLAISPFCLKGRLEVSQTQIADVDSHKD